MRSQRSRWPGELLLPMLVAIVETAAIAPLLALAIGATTAGGAGREPWPAALAALGLGAFWSTRLLTALGVRVGLARGLSLLLWLAMTLIWLAAQYEAGRGLTEAIPGALADLAHPLSGGTAPLLAAVALALLAWRRGLRYGSDPAPFGAEHLRTLVRVAFLLLAATSAVAALVGGPGGARARSSGRLAVPLAVVCGLLAVAATQLEEARRQAARRQGRSPGRGSWLTFAGGAALLIIATGLLVGGLLGQDIWEALSAPVVVGLRWLADGLLYLLILCALLLFFLVYPLIWLVQRAFGEGNAQDNRPSQAPQPPDFSQYARETQRQIPPGIALALHSILVAAVIVIGLLILLSALRRYRTFRHDEDADEQRESVWSRELALRQLRGAFSRHRGPSSGAVAPEFTGEPVSVREVYRALVALARRTGLGRQPAESASAFARRLRIAWPDSAPAIDDLTARYLRVRYGDAPDEADRAQVHADWDAIRRARSDPAGGTDRTAP